VSQKWNGRRKARFRVYSDALVTEGKGRASRGSTLQRTRRNECLLLRRVGIKTVWREVRRGEIDLPIAVRGFGQIAFRLGLRGGERVYQLPHVRRQVRLELQVLAGRRVIESQLGGMQGLARFALP
jgi:hypothetical protein